MNWHNYYQECLNMDENKRLESAKIIYLQMYDIFTEAFGLEKGLYNLLQIIATAICADNKLSFEEYELFNEITGAGYSFDELVELCKDLNAMNFNVVEKCDEIIDTIGEASTFLKECMIELLTIICAINGEITVEEQRLIEKYWQ